MKMTTVCQLQFLTVETMELIMLDLTPMNPAYMVELNFLATFEEALTWATTYRLVPIFHLNTDGMLGSHDGDSAL